MRNHFAPLICCLAAGLVLSGCGTRDYGPDEANTAKQQVKKQDSSVGDNQKSVVTKREPSPGYLWEGLSWIGLPDSKLATFKANLADDYGTDAFCSFGAAVIGGAVLGFIIRTSGSWFFGGPVDSDTGHWFWKRLDQTVKNTGQGLARGGLFAGTCYLLLTGAHPLPFDGLLGQDYRALSSSLVLGGTAAIAAAPFMNAMARRNWAGRDSVIGKLINRRDFIRNAADGFHEWSNTSEIGKSVRYKIAPGISIMGVGTGIGLIVHHWLQECDPNSDSNKAKSNSPENP